MDSLHLVDCTLRDGSHAMGHRFTAEQVGAICRGLDAAGLELVEVSHGDGIAGSSYNYGFSQTDEWTLLRAAGEALRRAKLTVLLLPGIGTVEDLQRAQDCGAQAVRVATHVTEADIAEQHIAQAKRMKLFTVGFLMMVHMAEPEVIAEQARKMEGYGADYINLADSAGYLLPDAVERRVEAVARAVSTPVGFHAHNNLGMASANALAAVRAGARYIDGTLRGLGAGAGNAQLELLSGIFQREGYETGVDFYRLMDLAEDVLEPMLPRPQTIRNASILLGYAGVYSSFLLHVERAGQRFGIDPRDILLELGRRHMVGGQEDQIIDVAYQMARGTASSTERNAALPHSTNKPHTPPA